MHARHRDVNVPTEVIRTVTVIADTGSFSKAGQKLGLSQPAISSQIKRLQMLVGGPIFDKIAGGVKLSDRGKVVLQHARRLLEANDQILLLGGTLSAPRPLRLGITNAFIPKFFEVCSPTELNMSVQVYSDNSSELAKGILDEYLDVACVINPPAELEAPVAVWREKIRWVKGRSFVLSPGAPIPLVSRIDLSTERNTIKILEQNGILYRIAFASADYAGRVAAVGAGLGLMTIPERVIAPPLFVCREEYLPPMPTVPAGIYARVGLSSPDIAHLIDIVQRLAPVARMSEANPTGRPEQSAGLSPLAAAQAARKR
jgi:DNA-binding transcriptional LysR family regulator